MAIKNIIQPDIINIDEGLRLRKFDNNCEFALEWYQDLDTVYMIDGDRKAYTMEYLLKMYSWWNANYEVYFIEVLEDNNFMAIGDVSFGMDDLPIVIGNKKYRGRKIATKVLKKLIERAKELKFKQLQVEDIYSWNKVSQACYKNLGFIADKKTKKGMSYKLILEKILQ